MKVGFDVRMIAHPGIGRYIRNLLNAMERLDSGHEFVLFGDRLQVTGCRLQAAAKDIVEWKAPVYSIQEQLSSPFDRYGLDIVHIPHFNVPWRTGKGKEKLVVTIHDLIYAKFPGYLPFLKRKAAAYLIKSAIARADGIIAVSENTRKDISGMSPDSDTKIQVIHEASDPQFGVIQDKTYLKRVKEHYSMPDGDILLFVGSIKKHKNLRGLLAAFKKIRNKAACSLVIAGRYHSDEPGILEDIKSSGAVYLGEVQAEELPAIYNIAKALVFPSFYEGFGLPLLEAFACGLPTVISDASSLPEIGGSASLYFNPYDIDDMCDKIYAVLTDKTLQKTLIEKGAKRLKDFSWQKTAEETLAAYETVLHL